MRESLQILDSTIDGSRNYVHADRSEFRIVHRTDHDTIYLSSHTGCGLGCRMCWLTESGQTSMRSLARPQMVQRASALLASMKASRVNFAFMARGDAMLNPEVDGILVRDLISAATEDSARHAKVTISTIFPGGGFQGPLHQHLLRRFGGFQPRLYWSLYTVNETRRREWLPKALEPSVVAQELARWQDVTGLEITIHHPLIEGVNDALDDAREIVDLLQAARLRYRVRLVRANPPAGANWRGAREEDYRRHLMFYQLANEDRAELLERVGEDVYASCGMFVSHH